MMLRDVLNDPVGNEIPDRLAIVHPLTAVRRRDRQRRHLQLADVAGWKAVRAQDMSWTGDRDEVSQLPQLIMVPPTENLRYGIRSAHAETRQGMMPAFGRDGMLKRSEVAAVTDYVRSLSNLPLEKGADLETGARVYAETCAACHGEKGDGNQELGAPSLADKIWLYGSDRAVIMETLWNGRGGMMPAWQGRLDETTIKALTVYVQTLGGGEK